MLQRILLNDSLVARTLMDDSSAARLTWRQFSLEPLTPSLVIASCGDQSRISPASVSAELFSNYLCLPFSGRILMLLY